MDNISCINKEKTLIELGNDIDKLKPSSCKLVYRNCSICKKEELIQYRSINVFGYTKCLVCSNQLNGRNNKDKISQSNIEYFKTHKHPRLGVKHTQEVVDFLRKNSTGRKCSDETKNKLRQYKGANNKNTGRKHTAESLKKMAAFQKANAKRGKDCNLYGKCYYAKHTKYLSKSGIEYKLKSGWELKVAQYLDTKNIIWEYEKQAFPVIYEYDGQVKDGTYTPDFFVGDEIWEVKGYWRKDAKIKFETFLKTYPQYKVKLIEKEGMKELGLL